MRPPVPWPRPATPTRSSRSTASAPASRRAPVRPSRTSGAQRAIPATTRANCCPARARSATASATSATSAADPARGSPGLVDPSQAADAGGRAYASMPAFLAAYLSVVAATCLVGSPAPLSLGRGADCGFRIDHPSVSRAHAVLAQHAGGWQLRDAGSKNGSYVDEFRVDVAELGTHGWFRLGDVICELATLSEQAADQAEVRLVEKRANSRFLA